MAAAKQNNLGRRAFGVLDMGYVSVVLEYRCIGSKDWQSVSMSPEDYFDLDDGEALSWDCAPQHSHAIDYLEIERRMIRNTKVTISDENLKVTTQITETFWGEGKNRVVERTDAGPSVNYWELIVETMINEMPPTWDILRLDRAEGVVGPNYHGVIVQNNDGSQTETKVEGSSHDSVSSV